MKEQLAKIDSLLNEISVKGEDVFRLATIRQILKELYDKEEK